MSTREQNLDVLLASLDPALDPDLYVFCSVPKSEMGRLEGLMPRGTFQEDEGLSVILTQADSAKAGLPDTPVFRRITLRVQSSLGAVGLTAAVAACLAGLGLPANIVAATYHDHIFVPAARGEEALEALRTLSASQTET
ncbi:MAG: ACT domain-containing protein [Rhodospirillaceae bacterium]